MAGTGRRDGTSQCRGAGCDRGAGAIRVVRRTAAGSRESVGRADRRVPGHRERHRGRVRRSGRADVGAAAGWSGGSYRSRARCGSPAAGGATSLADATPGRRRSYRRATCVRGVTGVRGRPVAVVLLLTVVGAQLDRVRRLAGVRSGRGLRGSRGDCESDAGRAAKPRSRGTRQRHRARAPGRGRSSGWPVHRATAGDLLRYGCGRAAAHLRVEDPNLCQRLLAADVEQTATAMTAVGASSGNGLCSLRLLVVRFAANLDSPLDARSVMVGR